MRFYLGILAIAAILIIIFLLLQESSDSSGSRPVATPAPTASPSPTSDDAAPFSHPPAPVAGASTLAGPATPVSQPPRPVAAPGGAPAISSMRAQIMSIAQQVGVQVVSYSDSGGWITVTVQGRERNNLNDFLDAAMRAGMKDIDEKQNNYKVITDRQLRQTHQNTYKMRF